MAKKNGFENHRLRTLIWIVRRLQRRPMSLSELNELWLDDEDISAGKIMERRTFKNYLNAIMDLFLIYIECNRSNGYKYKIMNSEISPLVCHLMDNFEQNLALDKATEMEDRIVVDKAPMGGEYLEKIMKAMEESRKITIVFQDFNDDEAQSFTGAPYCMRLYQQRWYVVMSLENGGIDPFCLDRIKELRIEKETFRMDPDFDAEEFFRYSFGVRVNREIEPTVIMLKVHAVQCGYLRTLPLHHSQKEIETTPDYSIFTIEVAPTVELMLKILSYGSLVEVLEPQWYREIVMDEVEAVYNTYFK